MKITHIRELLAAYEHKGIDPMPYYSMDQWKYGTCQRGGYGLSVAVGLFDTSLGDALTWRPLRNSCVHGKQIYCSRTLALPRRIFIYSIHDLLVSGSAS